MKKIAMLIMMAVATFTTFAQLAEPKITVRDTYYITKVLYNNMELDRADWPGQMIIEDPIYINIVGNKYKKVNSETLIGLGCDRFRFNLICNGKKSVLYKSVYANKYSGYYNTYDISNYIFYTTNHVEKNDDEDDFTPDNHATQSEVNTTALIKKSNMNKGMSQGAMQGAGFQGREGGDPNSNRYDGTPGKGGAGFSLTGRSAKALPCPTVNNKKEGKVVVKIWVDRSGNVTHVSAPEKGSTLTDAGYVQICKAAAMKAKFSARDDAPEVQTGTITYVFRNN